MAKPLNMTFDEVAAIIAYDPDTGAFTWRVSPCRRMKAGSSAGSFKNVRAGKGHSETKRYLYIRMKYMETPATRIAWLLQTGEWPATNVRFNDDDTTNLRFANLSLADFASVKYVKEGRSVHKTSLDAMRQYARKRYYGMSGEEYGEMLAAQKGVCAICARPETAMLRGTPKTMHVDHDHETGQLRALLCGKCNGMLGLAQDNPATLRAAADYLEHHAAQPRKVISGKFAVADKGAA